METASVQDAGYYAIRRFCPYQGVIQVVDVGEARAYSLDGRHWQVRMRTASGRYRWRGSVSTDTPPDPARSGRELLSAIRAAPPLPFPLADRFELWLLDRETRRPLALVKTRCERAETEEPVRESTWEPFLMSQNDFRSQALEASRRNVDPRARLPRAQDVLAREVNLAARPLPVLQWFERHPDGSGTGLGGLRVDASLSGRRLAAEDFPELLVRREWADPLVEAMVREYHEYHAPLLLAHQGLSSATRRWLESVAFGARPEQVEKHHAMYPEVLDPEGLKVALVSARLIAAS